MPGETHSAPQVPQPGATPNSHGRTNKRTSNLPGRTQDQQSSMFAQFGQANISGTFTQQNFNTYVQDRNQSISKPFQVARTVLSRFNSRSATGVDLPGQNAVLRPTERAPEVPKLADHEIYHEHLVLKKRGMPLWVPGPNEELPQEYRRNGINFGDVGIIWPGAGFDFLFNVFLPADDPVNRGGVPEFFYPLDLRELNNDIERNYLYHPYDYLASASLKTISNPGGLIFQSVPESANGAVLVMPDGSTSWNLRNTLVLDKYAELHLESWYKYAIERRGRSKLANGDIRIVSGFDKVSRWAMATFTSSNRAEAPVELELRVDRRTDNLTWCCAGAAAGRRGPGPNEMQGLWINPSAPRPQNQSIFVRTINPTLPSKVWKNIATLLVPSGNDGMQDVLPAASAPRPPSSRRPSSWSSSKIEPAGKHRPSAGRPHWHSLELETTIIHPSTLINQQLVEAFPDKMVITHDADWISMLKEEDVVFPDDEEMSKRILASHEIINDNGLVTIKAKEDRRSSVSTRCNQPRALLLRQPQRIITRTLGSPPDESDSEESSDEN